MIANVEFVCAFSNLVLLLSDSGPLLIRSLLYLCVCVCVCVCVCMFSTLVLPHLLVAMVLTKVFFVLFA